MVGYRYDLNEDGMITMEENLEVDKREADRHGNTLDEMGTERESERETETEAEAERDRDRDRDRDRERGCKGLYV
jgi:hypothetical protein